MHQFHQKSHPSGEAFLYSPSLFSIKKIRIIKISRKRLGLFEPSSLICYIEVVSQKKGGYHEEIYKTDIDYKRNDNAISAISLRTNNHRRKNIPSDDKRSNHCRPYYTRRDNDNNN